MLAATRGLQSLRERGDLRRLLGGLGPPLGRMVGFLGGPLGETLDSIAYHRTPLHSIAFALNCMACPECGYVRVDVQSTRRVRTNNSPKGTLASLSFALHPQVLHLRKTSTWPPKALASLSRILIIRVDCTRKCQRERLDLALRQSRRRGPERRR